MVSKNPIEGIIPNKLKVFRYIGEHSSVSQSEITNVFPSLNHDYTYQILSDLENMGLISTRKESYKNKQVELTRVGSDGYDAIFNGKIEDLFGKKEKDQDEENKEEE